MSMGRKSVINVIEKLTHIILHMRFKIGLKSKDSAILSVLLSREFHASVVVS